MTHLVYTSVFGGGLVLRGVELPKTEEAPPRMVVPVEELELPMGEPKQPEEELPEEEALPKQVAPMDELEQPEKELPEEEGLPREMAPMNKPEQPEEKLLEEEAPPREVVHVESLMEQPRIAIRPKPRQLGSWPQATATVVLRAMLGMLRPDREVWAL